VGESERKLSTGFPTMTDGSNESESDGERERERERERYNKKRSGKNSLNDMRQLKRMTTEPDFGVMRG